MGFFDELYALLVGKRSTKKYRTRRAEGWLWFGQIQEKRGSMGGGKTEGYYDRKTGEWLDPKEGVLRIQDILIRGGERKRPKRPRE